MTEGLVTQISDNTNHGYIAGRDLYLGDQYVVQETLFFEPDLANVEPEAWTTTPKAEELARALADHRLIVLAGQDMDDKTLVARHLAWLLREELPGAVRVREWYRSSDPQKIETAFHETDTTILLLPQVLPHHVGHRLNELTRVLQVRRNYAVITTDGTRSEWGIQSGSAEERLWQEISWETYYGRPFLAETLLTEIVAQNGHRPDWLPRDLQPGSLLAEGLTVEEVAARLKQPDRIQRFAQWLQTEGASPRAILAQLDQLGGDRAAIHQWYRQLAPSDQIFALGLVLFDGLPDDQIFAAVEYLVDSAWRRTDPNLPLFDYRDLARLGANFHLVESGDDGARIETTSRRKREAMLQVAWELQRRRLLAVVPAMTRLVKQLSPTASTPLDKVETKKSRLASWRRRIARVWPALKAKARLAIAALRAKKDDPKTVQGVTDEWRFTQGPERELFSSHRRIEQLQRSVIESLSQIGLLSFEAVEGSFLELGAEGSARVQTVVAKALAAWRGEGRHEKLFHVLRDWWEDGCRSTVPKVLAQRSVEGDPLAGIRATVALAVGYAVQYDPPNELAPELLSLLEIIVRDKHPAVRERVLEVTLPLAAASHPQQLEDLLRTRLYEDQEQMYAIALGIAMAFTLRPFGALRVLDNWHVMVRSQGARETGDRTITSRDRLLSAVAMAYGYIRCDPSQALLSTEQIVAVLRSILTTETHPFVRTHALMATGLQGLHDFELVSPLLIEFLSEIALKDRKNVVSVFVKAYLQQRDQLRGGDGEIEIAGRTYQTWLRSPRPLTPIEISLYSWLRDGGHPVARQVAAQTLAAFTTTELEQKERALGASQEKVAVKTAPRAARRVASSRPRLRRLPLLGYAAVYCVAPFQMPARKLVRPVLAEMIELERSHSRGTLPLLDRWRSSDDQEVQGLARSAAAAFRLYHWRRGIIAAQILCVILALAFWEWRWSNQESFSVEEAVMMQQRRNLSLRFAWDRKGSIIPPPPEEIERLQKKKAPPRIPTDLSERLLWSSIRTLAWKLNNVETVPQLQRLLHSKPQLSSEEQDWIRRRILYRIIAELLLEFLRNPEGFQETPQMREALREIERAFPGTRARTSASRRELSDFLQESAAPEPAEEETSQEMQEMQEMQQPELFPMQLAPGSEGIQIDPGALPRLEEIRNSLREKERPPQGEDHGHR